VSPRQPGYNNIMPASRTPSAASEINETQSTPADASPADPQPSAPSIAGVEPDITELRDFSRTVAEIEWLLVILVVLYHVFQDGTGDNTVAIYAGLVVYVAVILCFHWFNFLRQPQLWSLAVETWIMIVFVTWVLYHTGRLDSPLLNLYLLPIVTSALTLGQKVTLLQVGLIASCYTFLGYTTTKSFYTTLTAGDFATDLAPMLLVAYITTMLSQDILNAMARIKLISETDPLTGTYNMRAFRSLAARECALARRYNRILSLLMVDSDHLKEMNDTHGHQAGDRLIKHIVGSIRSALRTTDIVARYGGDEFVCLLPETGASGAAIVAERLRYYLEKTPVDIGTASVPSTVSIGIASFPAHGANFDSLAKNADRALYASKAQGRNRVTVFSPG
jgi:diguanylate cyclase (GGDEF)-like protein